MRFEKIVSSGMSPVTHVPDPTSPGTMSRMFRSFVVGLLNPTIFRVHLSHLLLLRWITKSADRKGTNTHEKHQHFV